MSNPHKNKVIHVAVDMVTKQELIKVAATCKKSVSAVIRRAIEVYLLEHWGK